MSPRVLVLVSAGFLGAAYGLVLTNRHVEPPPTVEVAVSPTAAAATPVAQPDRSLPRACVGLVSGEAIWNDAYQSGFQATRRGDHEAAKLSLCQALAAVQNSPADDWRFAETLDELGLVSYRQRDFETCVAMQGRAVAEILLAQGPDSPDVQMYIQRLIAAYKADGRITGFGRLRRNPYRIFGERDLIEWTPWMRQRLQWLRAEYLKREDMRAASYLGRVL